jgi:hypothetical protein
MEIILKTTLTYNPNELCIKVPVPNDNMVDTIALERRYAGWYATLDYTDADGISRSLGPDDWVRYRNTYTLEYNLSDAHYTVKITEHAEVNEISVCIFQESINSDEEHTDAYTTAE